MKTRVRVLALLLAAVCVMTAKAQVRIPAAVGRTARHANGGSMPARVQAAFHALSAQSRIAVRADGSLRFASNFESRFYVGEPEDVALSFVHDNPDIFGGAHAPTLRVQKRHTIGRHTAVRLAQTVDDIPVLGREVVLIVTDNRVQAIQSHYSSAEVRRGGWVISSDDAIAAARAYQEMKDPYAQNVVKAWVDRDGTLMPAWAITLVEADLRGDWLAVIDAVDGSVLEWQDLRQGDRAARGYAFPSNPMTGDMAAVPLRGLTDPKWLRGTYADIYTYYPAVKGGADPSRIWAFASPDSSGNYPYLPPDPRFSEVQTYFSLDRAARYFGSIGFPGLGMPIKALVWYMNCSTSGCSPINNAYYSSAVFNGEGGLYFGINADDTDPTYDSDVIYHEFTHAVVANMVGAYQGFTFSAINEGFADYFSSSAMGDPNLGEYAALIWKARLPYVRTVANQNKFPRNLAGEVHMDGNIWSGALWDVLKAIGAEAADEVALLTIASLTTTGEYYDAATAAVNAAGWLYGDNASRIVERIMTVRGLLGDSAALAADAHEIRAGKLPVIDSAPGDPRGQGYFADRQFRFSVPSGATAFTIKVFANGPVLALIKHRSPAVVYDDGSYNAEYLAGPDSTLTIRVDETSDPEIQAGWHYVWVAQLGSTRPVEYGLVLGIEYDGNKPTSTRATLLALDGNSSPGSVPVGQFLNSREFVVQVPQNATGLGIRLDGNTDVDLYIKYNGIVRNNSQGFPDADIVRASSSSSETAILTRNTIPTLQPGGIYMIGVYNYDDTSPAHFTVKAITTDAPAQATQPTPLSAGSTATLSFGATYGAAIVAPQQYVLTVPPGASGLRIRLDTRLDATCYIRAGKAVTLGANVEADYAFRSADRNIFEISTSSAAPLKAGTYYLAVASASDNGGTASVSYSIY